MIAVLNFVILVAALIYGFLQERAGHSASATFWLIFGYLVIQAIAMALVLAGR